MKNALIFFAALLFAAPAMASELRFQFTNPSFGGYPANGPYYLSEASAQNSHPAPTTGVNTQQSFSNTITNSLLNRVAENISDTIFAASDGGSGHFSIDDTTIDYSRTGGTITITLANGATGQSTQIELPATP